MMIYNTIESLDFKNKSIVISETSFYDGHGLLDDDQIDVTTKQIIGKIDKVYIWGGYQDSELHLKQICIEYKTPDQSTARTLIEKDSEFYKLALENLS